MGGSRPFKEVVRKMRDDPLWKSTYDGMCSGFAGASFGAALTAAGVHYPNVIIDQFRLTNFHMFNVYSVALGSSVFVILAIDRLGLVRRQVRQNTTLNIFSKYDGNIIGGALVGLGMSLSGSCPGTVFPQLAQGVPTAGITALGGVLGAMMHLWINRPSKSRAQMRSNGSTKASYKPSAESLTDVIGIPEYVLYSVAATVWSTLLYLTWPRDGKIWQAAAPGGLFLGLAQLVSILSTSSSLGSSGFYDQAGRVIWRGLGSRQITAPPVPPRSILFASGAVAGSYASTALLPQATTPTVTTAAIPWTSAFAGGFIMAFGAKMAKGCTSGHGLSGLGALSFASLISVVSMFGAGIFYQFV